MQASISQHSGRIPSRAAWLFAAFLASCLWAERPALAATLGEVTAVERGNGIIVISGMRLRVTATSRFYEATEDNGEETAITLRSVRPGDYVLFERDESVLKSLQRVNPGGVDTAPGQPMRIQRPR